MSVGGSKSDFVFEVEEECNKSVCGESSEAPPWKSIPGKENSSWKRLHRNLVILVLEVVEILCSLEPALSSASKVLYRAEKVGDTERLL